MPEYIEVQSAWGGTIFKHSDKYVNMIETQRLTIQKEQKVLADSGDKDAGDIDILVKPDEENARYVLDALSDFGFGSIGLDKHDFMCQNRVLQLGEPPRCVLILLHPFPEFHGTRRHGGKLKVSMEIFRFIILVVINSLKIKEPLEGKKTLQI